MEKEVDADHVDACPYVDPYIETSALTFRTLDSWEEFRYPILLLFGDTFVVPSVIYFSVIFGKAYAKYVQRPYAVWCRALSNFLNAGFGAAGFTVDYKQIPPDMLHRQVPEYGTDWDTMAKTIQELNPWQVAIASPLV
jgi:hypothetical protein